MTHRLLPCLVLLLAEVSAAFGDPAAAAPEQAAAGIIRRILPAKADQFILEAIPAEKGRDVFELESRDGRIVVRGSSGVAIASGWHYYLTNYCHCQVSLWGNNLALPEPLPPLPEKVRRVSPWKHRYYLNFCAFTYSVAWWDWPQWERLIDWMALQGVNMPLSVTGQEAIWRKVYRDLGLTDKQLEEFFVGPAFLPFGWMGCIDGWAGPLPQGWIDSHLELQKKIVARQRELGMTPVLQGFTGHVPAALKGRFPEAKLLQLPSWCGFPGTHFLDPREPLFIDIGRRFVEEQTRQFGTDHLYASDTFIEMQPPDSDPKFLAAMGRGVYEAMRAGDPDAVWVMQGWIFVCDPNGFWKPPQAKALLGAVPDERMILLDLHCEAQPVWGKTEGFYGKPWIWNVIQDFGDVTSLHGGLPQMADDLNKAIHSPWRNKLQGIGMVNEGLGTNPVVNSFIGEMAWRADVPAMPELVRRHARARYGSLPPAADEAWKLLQATAYCRPGQVGSVVCTRPAMMESKKSLFQYIPYDNAQLSRAWRKLLDCESELGKADGYRFDLVHVGRQALTNAAAPLHRQILAAYEKKDRKSLAQLSGRFLELIRDMDELTGTREEFLLGRYLADARRWAADEPQRKFYEWNARTMVTLWGPPEGCLYDYSRREWSGLLAGFYLPRWKLFFDRLDKSLADGRPLDAAAFDKEIRQWEDGWTRRTDAYPTAPSGDSVAVARRLCEKYAAGQK
jgi:alpha-N-acetylglucosaminidase